MTERRADRLEYKLGIALSAQPRANPAGSEGMRMGPRTLLTQMAFRSSLGLPHLHRPQPRLIPSTVLLLGETDVVCCYLALIAFV